MKPFYSQNGKYKDGRKKITIIYDDKKSKITLPKPEVLLGTLKVTQKSTKLRKEELRT